MSHMKIDSNGRWIAKTWNQPVMPHYQAYALPSTNPGWSPELNVKNATIPAKTFDYAAGYKEFCAAIGQDPAPKPPAPEVMSVLAGTLLDQILRLSKDEQARIAGAIIGHLRMNP